MGKKRKKYQAIEPRTETLDIEGPSFMGEGLARSDGDPVFVPYAIPGERVEATIFRKSRRYLEARLDKVIEPSPHRVRARVPPTTASAPAANGSTSPTSTSST